MSTREMAFRILSAGGYVPDKDGFTDLTYAAGRGHVGIIESLIVDFRRGIDHKDANKYTAMFVACWANQVAVVKILLTYGADPNCFASHFDRTPLMVAALRGHTEIVRILIIHRANVHVTSPKTGETALMCAAAGGDLNCVEAVLCAATPESIWKYTHKGLCALDFALHQGFWDVSKYLLHKSADDHWRRKEELAKCLSRLVRRLGIQ